MPENMDDEPAPPSQLTLFDCAATSRSQGAFARAAKFYVKGAASGYQPLSEDALIDAAVAALQRRFPRGEALTSPAQTKRYLQLRLGREASEVFAALWLDNRHRVLEFTELFRGTIDGASVYPREVVKAALSFNAAACILTHNHPSGQAEPSAADRAITQRLQDALKLIDVRVLDHIVVGSECYSFAESGLL